MNRLVRRAASAAVVAGGLAQELWSPRSDRFLANAIGWAGPWVLAPTPLLLADAVLDEDRPALWTAAAACGLIAHRAGKRPARKETDLTVYVQNVLAINRHSARLRRALDVADPDIAVLVELHDRHMAALEREDSRWHLAVRPHRAFLGIGVVSRHPIESVENFDAGFLPGLIVRTAGVTVVAVHLPSPVTRWSDNTRHQMEGAAQVASVIRGLEGPVVVGGDLNATRWNHAVDLIRRSGRLSDAVRGASIDWFLTFPTRFPLVRIDHCLVRGLRPRWARRLPSHGSDHRALLVGLDRE